MNPEFSTTILWRIENIGSWKLDTHDFEIFTPKLNLNNIKSQWQLCFFPDEFDFCFTETNDCPAMGPAQWDWSLLDGNGNTLLKRFTKWELTGGCGTQYMFFSFEIGNNILHRKSIFMADGSLTVRLRVRDLETPVAPMEHISIVTRLVDKSPKESLVWRIEKFRTFQLSHEAAASVNLKGYVFRLRAFLTGESLDLNIGIATENANLKSLKVVISFFNRRKRRVVKKHEYNSTESKQTWVVPKLVSMQEVLETPSEWLHGDDLIFRCEFEYILRSYVHTYIERSYWGNVELVGELRNSEAATKSKETKQCPNSITSSIVSGKVHTSLSWNRKDLSGDRNASMTTIGKDFFSVYRHHILCDFELLTGKASFHVHKFVLSARSGFFRGLFQIDDDDDEPPRFLQVSDLDMDSLGRFVTFLYTGTANDLHWWSAVKLYHVAHMYQVPSLQFECSNALRSNLALSNVCEVLRLAHCYRDRDLMSDVHDFIHEHFDEVLFSQEWDNFLERSCLAGKTMKEIYKRRNAYVHSLYVQ